MAQSLVPFANRLNIVTKDLQVKPLGSVMNYAQHEVLKQMDLALNERRRCRLIVLKARQVGISTITEAAMFLMAMIFKRLSGLVISHEADSAGHLLKMTNHYWETWIFRSLYTIRHNSVRHMSWDEIGSSIRIATAKNVGAGRSQTIQFLHGSEVGFWDDPDTLMTGLAQSIPQSSPSFIVLESTANGIGNYFHEEWDAAVDKESEYVPLFFPWHQHPEYTAAHIELNAFLGALNDEERVLKAIGINDDRLVWRRWAIRNLCGGDLMKFRQEYPTTPEEAFVVTGHNIFPDGDLTSCYQPKDFVTGYLVAEGDKVRFQESLGGPLNIYRWPAADMDWGKYMIAGDATRSITGDFSCAQVINRRTWEQVATWRGKIDPVSFGDQMALLGRFFHWAILCPEIQGAGDATISRLISLNYPFLFEHRKAERIPGQPETVYGWWSGVRAKQEAVGNLLKAVVDHDLILHDHKTYSEMRAYVADAKGGFGNGSGAGGKEGHDDTVTALAIAMTCTMYEAPNVNGGLGMYGGLKNEGPSVASINQSIKDQGLVSAQTQSIGDGVQRDEGVLPWELGDQEERLRNIEMQRGWEDE